MYYNGDGIPRDYAEAAKWLRVVAEKGSNLEGITLGYLYYAGLGVPQDYREALTWFRKGAEQHYPAAEYFLGDAYENGNGVTRDKAAACVWYLGASKDGDTRADERLKNLEAKMTAAQINEVRKQADDRIAQAFDYTRNDGYEEYILGLMYENDRFYADALKWYRKAADQGEVEAYLGLGVLYCNGNGVPKDYAQAFSWWREAAERGNSDAEFDIGTLYENGQGVPRDIAQARIWYQKAADGGDDEAKKRIAELDREH
jgi:TPR repeat protein